MKSTRTIPLLICVNLCLLFSGSGCEQVSSIDPAAVRAFAEDVNDLVLRVDAYQQVASAAIEQLQAQNIIDPNVAATVLAANADIDSLQATIRSVAASLQGAPYSDSGGLVTLLEAAQSANAASAPWNPYAAVIAAALTILSTVLGIAVKRKSDQAIAVGLKYQAHKQGVEKTMKQTSCSNVEEVKKLETVLYDNIGQARLALGVK